MVLYEALRSIMVTAVEAHGGLHPDRDGFTTALEAARDTVLGSEWERNRSTPQPCRSLGETRDADLTTMMDSSTFAEVCPAPCRLHRREALPFPCSGWTVRAVVPTMLTASGARATEAFVRLAPLPHQ